MIRDNNRHNDKLLMVYNGKRLLQYAVNLLSELPVDEKIVVSTGKKLGKVKLLPDIKVCTNLNPQEGQSSSIRLGLQCATGTHFLFLAADQPHLTVEDIKPIIELAMKHKDKIIYPLIYGKPCNPVIFPGKFKQKIMMLTGDTGGRVIRDAYPEYCISYTPEFPGRFKDINCEADI